MDTVQTSEQLKYIFNKLVLRAQKPDQLHFLRVPGSNWNIGCCQKGRPVQNGDRKNAREKHRTLTFRERTGVTERDKTER